MMAWPSEANPKVNDICIPPAWFVGFGRPASARFRFLLVPTGHPPMGHFEVFELSIIQQHGAILRQIKATGR
jgi:hypothetical protein